MNIVDELNNGVTWSSETDARFEIEQNMKALFVFVNENSIGDEALFEKYDKMMDNCDYQSFIFDNIKGYKSTLGIDEKFKDCLKSILKGAEVIGEINSSNIENWGNIQLRAYCTAFSLINIVKDNDINKEDYNKAKNRLNTEVKNRIGSDVYDISLELMAEYTDEVVEKYNGDVRSDLFRMISYCENRSGVDSYFERGIINAYAIYDVEKRAISIADKFKEVQRIKNTGMIVGKDIFRNYENRKKRWVIYNQLIDMLLSHK